MDRLEARAVEAMSAHPNVSLINTRGATQLGNFEAMVTAFVSAVLAAAAGLLLGKLLPEPNHIPSLALGSTMACVSYYLFYFMDKWLSISRVKVRYDNITAEEEPEPEPTPDGFIQSARQNERKRLTGRMRSLLETLAQHYGEINTLAVIPWYESKYLNRSQIEDVRAYMVLIGAADEKIRSGRSFVELSEWGRLQLPKWAVEDFGDLIELTAAPPSPNGR